MTRSWIAVGESRLVMGCALAVFALFAGSQLHRYLSDPEALYPDFFGFWSFGQFLRDHAAARIYDGPALMAFQAEIGPGFSGTYPYLYPPPFLLLLWPFGLMAYVAARIIWIAGSLAAFLLAVCGGRWRWGLATAAALAPATTVCLIYGQNGLLSAGLLIGGMRLARSRQILAGVLLGLLVYKPQLGLLVPIALIAAGLWRAMAAAAVTALALIAVSIAAFGAAMWPAWLATVAAASGISAADRAHLDTLMPTVSAAVRVLGGSTSLAAIGQIGAAAVAAAVVWRCWRRRAFLASDATLPVATILASPYAFGYDLPLVAGGALLALDDWSRRRRSFGFADLLAVLIAMLLPAVFISTISVGAPISVIALAVLLWRMTASEPVSPESKYSGS